MKRQLFIFASSLALSVNALALDLGGFLQDTHETHANYKYAEGSLLFHPDSFNGFELRASQVLRPNVALTGYLNRVSGDVLGVDVTGSQFGLGARYFFALQSVSQTDLDLSAAFVNIKAEADGASASDSGLLLGAQARRMWDKPIGESAFTLEETYAGLQVGIGLDDSGTALHGGVLVAINEQFSVRGELLFDDGTHVSLGVRMKLGLVQRNPEGSPSAVSARTGGVVMAPVIEQIDVTQPKAPTSPAVSDNPHGLTDDEMADLKKADE
ncbi:MAG: hypothetical protein ACPGSC_01030 [Granulosicoccaceae bacterium]